MLATGPLAQSGARVLSGQCLRTWHFAKPCLNEGIDIDLYTIPIPGANDEEADSLSQQSSYEGFIYTEFLTNNRDKILSELKKFIQERGPYDGCVGINAYPAALLAALQPGPPFWADLNGWTMAEGQTRAAIVGHNDDFIHFWRMESATVLQADYFSTVTERQGWALYGELAMLGRLVGENAGETLVYTVPNAVHPVYAALNRRIDPERYTILWSGGFNTWTDIDMLIGGLARAMDSEPRICFVSTGGAVHGHDEKTYQRFLKQARESLDDNRCKHLGWAPMERVLELHATAYAGLNIDGANIETRFGARNRLTNMMGCGLPVITTAGTEIAEWIAASKLGIVIPPANADALANAILSLVNTPELARSYAEKARSAALQEFAAANTLKEFLTWAKAPRHSPGRIDSDRPMMIREDG